MMESIPQLILFLFWSNYVPFGMLGRKPYMRMISKAHRKHTFLFRYTYLILKCVKLSINHDNRLLRHLSIILDGFLLPRG